MKTITLFLVTFFSGLGCIQATAISTFSSAHHYKLQLIIDGKVINRTPKPVVKMKSGAGMYRLKIKAFDNDGCLVDVVHKTFYARSGYDSKYRVYIENNATKLKCTQKKVIYHERLRRPDRFYNHRYIAQWDGYPSSWFSMT